MNTQNYRTHLLKNGQLAVVRQATPDDAAELTAFFGHIAKNSPHFASLDEPVEQWLSLDSVCRKILACQSNGGAIYLAFVEEMLAGAARVFRYEESEMGDMGRITAGVLTSYRELGIGTALLYSVIGWARTNPSLDLLTLNVNSSDLAARMLYEKMGFLEEGLFIGQSSARGQQYAHGIEMYKFVK